MQVFISYSHTDKSDALYIRSIVENVSFKLEPHIDGPILWSAAGLGATIGMGALVLMPGLVISAGLGASLGASYLFASKKNRESAKAKLKEAKSQLEQLLSKEFKLAAWMDDDIPPGSDWYSEIQNAVKASDFCVVLVPDIASTNVSIECGLAVAHDKKIVPLVRSIDHLNRYNLNLHQAFTWPDKSEEWKNSCTELLITTSKSVLKESRHT